MIYTLEELRQEYQAGKTYKYVFFWKPTPSKDGTICESCLGQWWMKDFVVNDITYSCAEQYMMAEKARLFHDDDMLTKIMETNQPKEMKAFGRAVQHFVDDVWNDNCYNIVKTANEAKFNQNPELLTYLLGTKNRILVEASPRDRIWGIGMGASNPDSENPMKWRGKNLLGFALTEVRDELMREVKE